MDVTDIIQQLLLISNDQHKQGMSRFGINTGNVLGIKIPVLRQYAKTIGKNHLLALELWKTNIHEARLLAIFIADPKKVDVELMEQWVRDFDSWDICDQCCSCLFERSPVAFEKAMEWAGREEEFVKRAGFVLMATLAVHQKKADDQLFLSFFSYMEREAGDDRNFVKKAVNWALRQIGKRSAFLNSKAIEIAEKIGLQNSKSARWIAADALKELRSDKQQLKLVKHK